MQGLSNLLSKTPIHDLKANLPALSSPEAAVAPCAQLPSRPHTYRHVMSEIGT